MRIAFLVDPESTILEDIDQIIDYNRSLWGGRFNPFILTDGRTIDDKWWQFLRDIDPDVIKPLIPLGPELVEKIENFLSPLKIEQPRAFEQSDSRMKVRISDTPAGINVNSINFPDHWAWHGKPTLGVFDLDEMDDDVGKRFVLRNFGTYEPTNTTYHISRTFSIPYSLEDALTQGEVPSEVHEGFAKGDIPFSKEAFSKPSLQSPGSWAIIDKEYNQIQYVNRSGNRLTVQPHTQRFLGEVSEINKKVCLITDRESLAATLLEFVHTPDVIFRDQICALPNEEREIEEDTRSAFFDIIVGDTLQDITYFWNRPLSLPRWKRGRMNPMWLPTTLAKDTDMKEALCAWINRVRWIGGTPETIRFVSFSTEKQELEDIANGFQRKLWKETIVKCFKEPQIPNFCTEDLFFTHIGNGMDIHRAQSNEETLELVEPKELSQSGSAGHWMADFYIEFTHDRYGNHEDVIKRLDRSSLFWRFPNRNHLMHHMFDKPSRVKRNGFPSVMLRIEDNVLRFVFEEAESVVASLFWHKNRPVDELRDPRTQLATAPYYFAEPSDKGKYLQGVLELFGNLTFAYEVLRNPYWRTMFDLLSKNTRSEQNAHESIANRLKKEIGRSGALAVENSAAIRSIAKLLVNEAKKLDFEQKEFPFDEFIQEAERRQKEYMEKMQSAGNQSEMDMENFGFRKEDVKVALAQLTHRNIIQIGINPHCPRCGLAQWYHVDDIGQHLTCQGCRIPFSLHPELTWHYRLNELIHAAHALHGTTPVILVLGQLFRECRISFLFSHNLNLLTKPKDKFSEELDKAAEVDIACIQDGQFIIGEVKQSRRNFSANDFDIMAEIAERAKPDRVIFSCIDSQKPTSNIFDHMERIRSRLSPLEIEVTWYELEDLDYSFGV